jgi:hypothetical protein
METLSLSFSLANLSMADFVVNPLVHCILNYIKLNSANTSLEQLAVDSATISPTVA